MGWSSGGEIFDRVARKLLDDARVPDRVITDVCAELIDALTDGDWDTLDESIQTFRNEPTILDAFRRAAPDWMNEDAGDAGGVA